MFDLTKLKVSEVRIVEARTGGRFTDIFSDKGVDFAGLAAIIWVLEKRSKPTVTIEEIEDWEIGQLTEYLGLNDEEPETDPLAKAATEIT